MKSYWKNILKFLALSNRYLGVIVKTEGNTWSQNCTRKFYVSAFPCCDHVQLNILSCIKLLEFYTVYAIAQLILLTNASLLNILNKLILLFDSSNALFIIWTFKIKNSLKWTDHKKFKNCFEKSSQFKYEFITVNQNKIDEDCYNLLLLHWSYKPRALRHFKVDPFIKTVKFSWFSISQFVFL